MRSTFSSVASIEGNKDFSIGNVRWRGNCDIIELIYFLMKDKKEINWQPVEDFFLTAILRLINIFFLPQAFILRTVDIHYA